MARKIIDYKAAFQGWEKEIDIPKGPLARMVDLALDAARGNACETEGVEFESPEWFELAYGSISFTSAFDQNVEVRDWFAARGYKW